jgi:hypothetical protein
MGEIGIKYASGSSQPYSTWLAACFSALVLLCLASTAVASEGTLIESHGDTFHGESVDRTFSIASSGREVRLSDPQPTGLVGQPVKITDADPTRGGIQGRVRAIEPDQRVQDSPPPGPQSVLVLLLTTPDDPIPAAPDATVAKEKVFSNPDSVAAYYALQSNGATTLVGRTDPVGDVLGPIALNTPMAGCPYQAIADEADQRAAAGGYLPVAYDHVVYVMPSSGECDFGGRGQMPGTRVWSNGSLTVRVLAHELGHNMGANHANSLACVDQFGNLVPYSETCTSTEYGDPFDVIRVR